MAVEDEQDHSRSSESIVPESEQLLKPDMDLSTIIYMPTPRILKNVTMISVSCMMFFTGFQSLANLQSTMNSDSGLGMYSQAAIYGSSLLPCLLLPELMITKLGCKTTLLLAFALGCPFIASNFYPTFQTMMPTSVLFGLVIGPIKITIAFYINEMTLRYKANVPQASLETIAAWFYGIFACFTESTQIWGNLFSYYILQQKVPAVIINETVPKCGIEFDLNYSNSNLEPPTDEKRYILVGICTLCGVASLLIVIFSMDALLNDMEVEPDKNVCRTTINRVLAAIKHLKDYQQLLLLPLSIFCGMETAFYTGDFAQAFIACSWGIEHVGFVTICFGVFGALMSLLMGPLVKCFTQMGVVIVTGIVQLLMFIMLYVWKPSPEEPVLYFVFAGLWGGVDAVWWSQVPALYGLMFPDTKEAAFSNFFFWSNMGYFICFIYSTHLNIVVKINILIGVIIVSMIGYLIGQLKIRCGQRRHYVTLPNES